MMFRLIVAVVRLLTRTGPGRAAYPACLPAPEPDEWDGPPTPMRRSDFPRLNKTCAALGYAPRVRQDFALIECPRCSSWMWCPADDIAEDGIHCSGCFSRAHGLDHATFMRTIAAAMRTAGLMAGSIDETPRLGEDDYPEGRTHAPDH